MKKTITVAIDFSKFPAGRFLQDGRYSGQRFREQYLFPELMAGNELEILLDDVEGYGSSFLEEAFGGLIREGVSPQIVKSNLTCVSELPSLIDEINFYIDEAIREKQTEAALG